MRKLLASMAAVTAIFAAASVTNRADAMTFGAPAAVRIAADSVDVFDQVHCRPYVHWHPWGWGTGCYRPRVYYAPPVYVAPRPYWRYRYGRRRWR